MNRLFDFRHILVRTPWRTYMRCGATRLTVFDGRMLFCMSNTFFLFSLILIASLISQLDAIIFGFKEVGGARRESERRWEAER